MPLVEIAETVFGSRDGDLRLVPDSITLTVKVTDRDTGLLADVFSDSAGAVPAANPIPVVDGQISGYVDSAAKYRLTAVVNGVEGTSIDFDPPGGTPTDLELEGRLSFAGSDMSMGMADAIAWDLQGEFPYLVFIPAGVADGSGIELRGHPTYENPLVGFGVLGTEAGVHLYDVDGRFLKFDPDAGGTGKPGIHFIQQPGNDPDLTMYLDAGVLHVDGDINGTAPTQPGGTNDTTLATTAYADNAVADEAATRSAADADLTTRADDLEDDVLALETGKLDTPLIIRDRFTDASGTAITAHAADTGETWALHPGENFITPVISDANRLRMGASGNFNGATVMLSELPADADVIVAADCVLFTDDNTQWIGLWARLDPVALNGYMLQHQGVNGWTLYRCNAGVFTSLQNVNRAFDGYIELCVSGQKTTTGGVGIQVRRNGHPMIQYEDNGGYITNGRAGVRIGGRTAGDTNATGKHLENIIVTKAFPHR